MARNKQTNIEAVECIVAIVGGCYNEACDSMMPRPMVNSLGRYFRSAERHLMDVKLAISQCDENAERRSLVKLFEDITKFYDVMR